MRYKTLIDIIAEQDDKSNLCLSDQDQMQSHKQLLTEIAYIHARLQEIGIQPEDRIVVQLPRSLKAFVVIYAIVTYGCTYVPIDIKAPPNRQEFIINDVKPKLIIDAAFLSTFSSSDKYNILFKEVNPDSLAAILYTSGSTGAPKGIALSHRAIVFFATWAWQQFGFDSRDHLASLAPLHFDLSLLDLFVPWLANCKLTIMPDNIVSFPIMVSEFLVSKKISAWYTVPSMLNYWVQKGAISNHDFSSLRLILFAGEVYPHQQIAKLKNLLPHTQLYNLFGPTETNVCTFWHVTDTSQCLPIGQPLPGLSMRLGPEQTLQIKGPNLFSGYFCSGKLKQLTQDWYDTGDIVYQDDKGILHYQGRSDRMVKINGHRVELAEVESALNAHTSIIEAAVTLRKNHFEQMEIIAFYVTHDDFDLKKLQQHLQLTLPRYMQPVVLNHVDALPRLSNGKVNLLRLAELAGQSL